MSGLKSNGVCVIHLKPLALVVSLVSLHIRLCRCSDEGRPFILSTRVVWIQLIINLYCMNTQQDSLLYIYFKSITRPYVCCYIFFHPLTNTLEKYRIFPDSI